jgi:hypothetical protein
VVHDLVDRRRRDFESQQVRGSGKFILRNTRKQPKRAGAAPLDKEFRGFFLVPGRTVAFSTSAPPGIKQSSQARRGGDCFLQAHW